MSNEPFAEPEDFETPTITKISETSKGHIIVLSDCTRWLAANYPFAWQLGDAISVQKKHGEYRLHHESQQSCVVTKIEVHAGSSVFRKAMLVVLCGLLVAMASWLVMNRLLRSRCSGNSSACINNLNHIQAAKAQYVLEFGGTEDTVLTASNIAEYLEAQNSFCPAADEDHRDFESCYRINAVTNQPECEVTEGWEYPHSLSLK